MFDIRGAPAWPPPEWLRWLAAVALLVALVLLPSLIGPNGLLMPPLPEL